MTHQTDILAPPLAVALHAETVAGLVLANRILANEEVLDGLGHVSVRDPGDPATYLISRSRSPALVEVADICAFDLASRPRQPRGERYYAERVIHGAIYAARPDVGAVCHFHAAAVLPFANTGTAIVPVQHLGAVIGTAVPFWDAREEFGDTDMLVSTEAQARALAAALGVHWSVVIRRHGAVVVGRDLREAVFRSIQFKTNCEVQLRAQALGPLSPLTPGEIAKSAAANLSDAVLQRTWDYWMRRATKGTSAAGLP